MAFGRDRVYLIHTEALRHNPGDIALERRCAELALDLGRYGDAQSYLIGLLDRVGKESARPGRVRAGGTAGSMPARAEPL